MNQPPHLFLVPTKNNNKMSACAYDMNDINCDACEHDHETKDLIRSIKHTIGVIDNSINMLTEWGAQTTAPENVDYYRHKIEQINLPCRDVLTRAVELLETTSTNFAMANAVHTEVTNIIGLATAMKTYRACDVKFCSCKMRVLYCMIGTPDILPAGQLAVEDEAHRIHYTITNYTKSLEILKNAHADALRNLANFRWNIHAPPEEELELIQSLASSAERVKEEMDNTVRIREALKKELDQQEQVLYDMFCL